MSQKQAQLLASAIGGGGLPSVIGADNTLLTSTGAVAQWETLSSLIDAVFGSTRGMMLRRGASAWEAFAKGTQYQALTGGATDPTWAAIDVSQASAITGTLGIGNGGTGQTTANPAFNALAPTTTRGDLIRRGASVNERVALGATGTILGSDGTDPIWRTLTAILDAVIGSSQGTIIKRGASSWEALAKGTSTYVLTAGASDISWAAPASSGQPIPTSSSYAVGSLVFMYYSSVTAVTNGSTAGGGNLEPAVGTAAADILAGSAATQSGTWLNVSGQTQDNNGTYRYGYWVRTV